MRFLERHMRRFGHTVHFFETCESTNEVAMHLAREGCLDGTIVIAEHQTRGKGRAGRTWESWPGNLAISLVLRPTTALESSHLLVMASALATVTALEALSVSAKIKWPNDVLIESPDGLYVEKLGPYRKIGGILLEVATTGSRTDAAVIGIGLNIMRPPKEKESCILPQMGFIRDSNAEIDLLSLTNSLLDQLEKFLAGDASELLEQMKKRSAVLGKPVSIDLGDRQSEGIAIDLSADGSLVVRTQDGKLERIFYGDVSLLFTGA